MNCKLVFALLFVTLTTFSVFAQSDTTSSDPSWFVSVHAGVLMPQLEKAPSFSATLTPGVRYDRFALIVGTGYETYSSWRMVPLFAGVSYDFIRGQTYAVFVQANAGYSKAWNSFNSEFRPEYKNEGGYFYHPFVGFRLRPGKVNIYWSFGYKIQQLTYDQEPGWGWGGNVKTTVDADMHRFSMQVGIGI